MTTPSDRRVPDLESECPRPIADFAAIEAALHARHDRRLPAGEAVEFAGRVGADAAAIVAVLGYFALKSSGNWLEAYLITFDTETKNKKS